MVDVSIIIVNYNAAGMLKECIDSIINCTSEVTYEIIVVDNNSSDADLNEIFSGYSNIKLIINKKNKGYSTANNQGLEKAKGKYTLFLNNDTLFIENTLLKILKYADLKGKLFVGCKLLNKDRSHQISVVDFDTLMNLFGENSFLYKLFPESKLLNKYNLHYSNPDKITEVDAVKGAFIFGVTNDFKELNGFDERFFFYNEENDLCYRFKQSGGKIIYFPVTSIIHLGGATTDTMLWFRFKNQSIAKIQFFQKHWKGFNFTIAILIHYFGIFLRVPLYALGGILTFNSFLLKKSWYYFKTVFIYPGNKFKNK